MSAKWNYDENNVAYADGTGTYAAGWYAASPSTGGAGQSPESGPFATRGLADTEAEKLAAEEAADDVTEVLT